MKILNFGSCNMDFVYSLDHIVEPGETETTYKMETFPGGKGLNQSIAAAKAGAMRDMLSWFSTMKMDALLHAKRLL